jgi:hypothetical protein
MNDPDLLDEADAYEDDLAADFTERFGTPPLLV